MKKSLILLVIALLIPLAGCKLNNSIDQGENPTSETVTRTEPSTSETENPTDDEALLEFPIFSEIYGYSKSEFLDSVKQDAVYPESYERVKKWIELVPEIEGYELAHFRLEEDCVSQWKKDYSYLHSYFIAFLHPIGCDADHHGGNGCNGENVWILVHHYGLPGSIELAPEYKNGIISSYDPSVSFSGYRRTPDGSDFRRTPDGSLEYFRGYSAYWKYSSTLGTDSLYRIFIPEKIIDRVNINEVFEKVKEFH